MRRRDVPVVSTGMVLLPSADVIFSNFQGSGFSHVSIFNQEILNPSKFGRDDCCEASPDVSQSPKDIPLRLERVL
jgi:hypothetical protein